jgi:hypothetical protein
MRIAFSIALLATLGLAYSVFFHDGMCGGKKNCGLTPTSTTLPGNSCTKGCCSDKVSAGTANFVGTTVPPPVEGSATGSCCSKATQNVALKQDEECTASCSHGKTCCQEQKPEVLVSIAGRQDDEKCCQDQCSTGGSCCQKGETTSTVAVKQDGHCSQCPASCKSGECTDCPGGEAMVSTEKHQDQCAEGKTCCMAEAMKKLPAMTYKVGTETTCCSATASKMAEKSAAAIHYVVASEEFECKEKAYTALVEKTESFVTAFVNPAKCQASGQTTVCDKSFACSDAAAKQSEVVVNAIKDIKVGYQVGGKKAGCINCAKTMAEKENAPIEYVVNGQSTKCELHARLMAAQAKYVTAVKALTTTETSVSSETTEKTETKSDVQSEG